ncbi:MAG: twin-arginine translocase TatA/TatE family subunit [Clostridiales bacterium]|nr:twin-arginine translocase TatA/TatE family subunit [Clostridiales bacterium]
MKISTTELLIVLAVVVIIFGPTQIPKLTKMFGQSMKSFREGIGDGDDKKVTQDASEKKD